MTDLSPDLRRLGNALERAAAADLSARRRSRLPRRLLLVAVALAIAVPTVAFAATRLISNEEVARSLPAGTKMLQGSDPSCTVVKQDVEYRCVLARPPVGEIAPGQFMGTVEPTVDATKHVNGGCRSLSAGGREWECYIGQAAVDQEIISEGFLGEYAPAPGVG